MIEITDAVRERGGLIQMEMFAVERPSPEQIVERMLSHDPVAIFAMFSGGDGSLGTTHWCMNNIPRCEVLHINTGIGFDQTRIFVRETCAREGWPLTEIKAKEDCGQDYDEIVREHGFPGPKGHQFMYARLKERAVELIVRQRKTKRSDKVALLTGICHDDSVRRSGYGGREVNFKGGQMWVNPMYWAGQSFIYHYLNSIALPRNPVAIEFGMSGECCCGAYAKEGELRIIRRLCPALAARIEALQAEVAETHPWGWEGRPPAERDTATIEMFSPMCVNCLKSERISL